MMVLTDDCRKLLGDTQRLSEELLSISLTPGDHHSSVAQPLYLYLFFFETCLQTFNAFAMLLREGLGKQAIVLTRMMFEAVVNWLYIEREPGARSERYMMYARAVLQKYLGHCKEVEDLANIRIGDPSLEETALLKQHLSAFLEKYELTRLPRRWSEHSLPDCAKEVGQLHIYRSLYPFQSDIVHSGPAYALIYFREKFGGTPAGRLLGNDMPMVCITGCYIMLLALQAADRCFGLHRELAVNALTRTLASLLQKYRGAT